MTRLKARLVRRIEAFGPIPVADYMAACLFDPLDGYYTTRDPLGAAGDFVTAPEISQMFGELMGVWVHGAWEALGRPTPLTVVEIGPGRGTMMADMVRALNRVDPGFVAATSFVLVEASERLADVQRRTLERSHARFEWTLSVDALPETPALIVANELFDALPVRQFVKAQGMWPERMIGIDEAGELCFNPGAGSIDPGLLPPEAGVAPDGAIVELAPAREALMDQLAERMSAFGGAGLFIDYGYAAPALGDTLQALRRHAFEDALASPGEADLTAHVDFAALAAVARRSGLTAKLTTQGKFLLAMGLLERAGALGAKADDTRRADISGEVQRLAGTDAMGDLFKVLLVAPPGAPVPFPGAS